MRFDDGISSADDEGRELLELLNDTLDIVEGPPPDIVNRAVGLFALRHFDAELLTLLTDSFDAEHRVLLRSELPTWRIVAFKSEGFVLELEIASAGGRSLIGQIDPPDAERILVFGADSSTEVELDEHGRFRVAPLPPGPFRVLATKCDGTRIITPVLIF